MDLVNELFNKTKMLSPAIKRLAEEGKQLATKERDYKITLRQHALKLRETDMAIGMIDKTVYGIPEVANLRFERDVADTLYKVALEYLNTLKLEIRVLQSQLDKEWSHDQS
jgi:hypothetical protein